MLLSAGDHIVAGKDIYGGTYRLLHKICNRAGIDVSLVEYDRLGGGRGGDSRRTRSSSGSRARAIRCLSITDIAACAEIARRHGALLGVDNTFATPVLTRPLELGADIVMHSGTKYIGGHSDVLGGALAVKDPRAVRAAAFRSERRGHVLGPFESFLCGRGLKTLELRVREHACRTAHRASS